MGVEIYQGGIARKIVIRSIDTKVGIGDSGMGHIDAVNNPLKEGRRALVGVDVVNGGKLDGGIKAKRTTYLTKRNQQVT